MASKTELSACEEWAGAASAAFILTGLTWYALLIIVPVILNNLLTGTVSACLVKSSWVRNAGSSGSWLVSTTAVLMSAVARGAGRFLLKLMSSMRRGIRLFEVPRFHRCSVSVQDVPDLPVVKAYSSWKQNKVSWVSSCHLLTKYTTLWHTSLSNYQLPCTKDKIHAYIPKMYYEKSLPTLPSPPPITEIFNLELFLIMFGLLFPMTVKTIFQLFHVLLILPVLTCDIHI